MSWWTHIHGVISVDAMGRTQPEKKYILDTILEHLPIVTGSEKNMDIYVLQKAGYDESSSHDEFGDETNNLVDAHGNKVHYPHGWQRLQNTYFIVVNGDLRDRMFEETVKEFNKWLCRLSKRILVKDVLINIEAYDKHLTLNYRDSEDNPYYNMFEWPSWCNKSGEPTWCEYLMWDSGVNTNYPLQLAYKYFNDEINDAEYERRYGGKGE